MFAAQKLPEMQAHHSQTKDLLQLNQRATNSQTATATTLNSVACFQNNNDLFSTKQLDEINLLRSS